MKLAKLCIFFLILCQSFFVHAQTAGEFQEIVGSPFAAGSSPRSIAYSPLVNGNLFAAEPNASSNNVIVYSVDTTTGAFTPVAGSPFDTGTTPIDIAFSPLVNGNLFATISNSGSNNVWVYSVDTTTGAFTPVAGSPFAAGTNPGGIAFSPLVNGNLFAAVVNVVSNNITAYQVDTTTGAFTPVAGSPFTVTGIVPIDIAYSPLVNGNLFAAVTNLASNNVEVYSVDTTTGAFTPVAGSPFATGNTPVRIAFSPLVDGNLFAAVTNQSSDSVSVYSVDTTTGVFTPVTGSPFATGDLPVAVAYSPVVNNNLFAAVANQTSNNISVYAVTLPPTVTSINPTQGPTTGGTIVTITGTDFAGTTSVLFGAIPALTFIVDSDTQITAISPPGIGTVDVTVTTPAGTSATSLADQFTYVAVAIPPAVTSISPTQGPTTGGTIVTITGTNFSGTTAVLFGATPALTFIVDSDTQITAVSPPGIGTVDVTVTTPAGTSATSLADQFTYIAIAIPPTVTGVNPNQGPTAGGTTVIITGTHFTGTTAVLFGATSALSFTVDSDTQITAVSPPGTGTVDVTVTSPAGTSTTSSADQFTYIAAPLPPRDLKGCQRIKVTCQFSLRAFNILTWKAPSDGSPVVVYQIYRDKSLTRLVGEVSSDHNLRFKDHVRRIGKTQTYYIVSVNEFGVLSEPAKVRVNHFCGRECCHHWVHHIKKCLRNRLI